MTDPLNPEAPFPLGAGLEETVRTLVENQLAQEREKHQAEMDNLRSELESAQRANAASPPSNLVPFHGGGPGTEIAPTWSQAQQEEMQN